MIFNYDRENGWSNGLLDLINYFKSDKPVISDDLINQFVKFRQGMIDTKFSAEAYAETIDANVNPSIINYAKTTKASDMTVKGFTQSIQGMTLSAKAGTVAMKALAMAGNMLLMWGVTKVISLAAKGIDNYVHRVENAVKKSDELISSLGSKISEINEDISDVQSLSGKFKELSKYVDEYGNNISLTTDEYSEYKDIVKQLITLNPLIVTGYDSEGRAIINKNTALEETVELLKQERDLELQKATSTENLTTIGEGAVANRIQLEGSDRVDQWGKLDLKTVTGQASRFGREAAELFNEETIKAFYSFTNSRPHKLMYGDNLFQFLGIEEKDLDLASYLQSNIDVFAENMDEILYKANIDPNSEQAKSLKLYVQEWQVLNKELKSIDTTYIDEYVQKIPQLVDGYSELTDIQKNFISEYLRNNFSAYDLANNATSVKSSIISLVENISNDKNIQESINSLFALSPDLSASDYVEQYKQIVEDIIKQLNLSESESNKIRYSLYLEIEDNENLINQVQDKLKELGFSDKDGFISSLSFEELKAYYSIISSYDSEYKSFEDTKSAYFELKSDIEKNPIKPTFTLLLTENEKAIDNYQSNLKTIESSLSNIASLNASDIIDLMQQFSDFDWDSYGVTGVKGVGDLEGALKALTLQQFNVLKRTLDQTNATDEQIEVFKSLTQSILNPKKSLEDWQDLLATTQSKISDYNSLIDEMNSKDYKGLTSNMIDSITSKFPELISYLGDEKELRNQLTKLITSQTEIANDAYRNILEYSDSYYSSIKLNEAEKINIINKTIKETVNGNAQLVSKLGKNYEIDLKNFENIVVAKEKLEKELIINSATAWSKYYKVEVNRATGLAGITQGSFPTGAGGWNESSQKAWENSEQGKAASAASAAVKAYNEAIKGLDEIINSTNLTLPKGISTNKKGGKTVFSDSIDWVINSIKNLNKELDNLYTKLNNTNSWSKQLKIQDQIITKQEKLEKAYKKSADYYRKYYDKISSGLNPNYVSAIVSGEKFSIEQFTGENREKVFKKIQDVQKAWELLQDAESNYLNAKYKTQEEKDNSLQIQVNKYDAITDKLNAKLDNADSWQEQNKILKSITEYQKKSYYYQIQLAKTDEDRIKLQQELKKLITENAKAEFLNIQDDYNNKLSLIDARQQRVQSKIDLTEAKGYQVGSAYYNELIALNKEEKDRLVNERNKLQSTLNNKVKSGEITKGTRDWNEMVTTIQSVGDAIDSVTQSTLDLNKSLQQLAWDRFDNLLIRFDGLISESDFLIDLMSKETLIDDNGKYTDKGLATIGQHGINYNTYMAQAEEIAKELSKLDKNSLDKDVQDRINELTQARYSSIKSANEEKQAIIDLVKDGVQAEINAFSELINKKKEALDAEKNLYEYQKSIAKSRKTITQIQKQINALQGDDSDEAKKKLRELKASLENAQSELNDTVYNKNIDDQKKYWDDELTKYKKTSEEYMKDNAKMFEDAMKEVNSSSTQISKTLTETANKVGYSISENIKNAWVSGKSAFSDYSKEFVNKSATILGVIENIRQAWIKNNEAYETYAKNTIEQTQLNNKNVTGATNPKVSNYKDVLGSNNVSKTSTGDTKLNQYVTGLGYKKLSFEDMYELGKALGVTGINSVEDVQSGINAGDNRMNILSELKKRLIKDILGSNNISKSPTGDSELNKFITGKGYAPLTYGDMVNLAKVLELDNITSNKDVSGNTSSAAKNRTAILNALQKFPFKDGGMVADINKVIKGNGDDAITTVQKKEIILNKEDSKTFRKQVELMPEFSSAMKTITDNKSERLFNNFTKPISNSNVFDNMKHQTFGDLNLEIHAPNIRDTETLITELKTPRVQNVIRHTVLDIPLGKGNYNVNKY
ncbi:hypothetical protein KQI61_07895 [Anaerocolumna aminovalerica]|uniref:hypothetical protein n=1 Tax=Anaerocolumna aminovalerica TaxID=1527 RepID=UPI001C0F1BC8|nr:hypothetical protein [Anaerocolumna aminovalerica]MBU5332118.1 hypothetical protein [Anaerocolumna aminovalerica]